MVSPDQVVGCILAGGQSSRMGGGDKGLRPIAGRPMIARVAERLGEQVGAVVLNANGDPARFAGLRLPVVADPVEGFAGPLAGVLAGLDWAAEYRPEAVFVATAAADTPFFPDVLVDAMLDEAATADTVVLAASDEGRHPVFGLWPVALREDLRAFLARGETRKVLAWVERHPHATVRFPPLRAGDRLVDPFFNVNTPVELEEAERIAAEWEAAPAGEVAVRDEIPAASRPLVIGVAGFKNTGKTTLVTRLIAELVGRGLRVASVKHAHHAADIDKPGTDSYRHREAGAFQTALVTADRVAVMRAYDTEPPLSEVLAALAPADVVMVEGYKRAAIAKIEVRRRAAGTVEALHPGDPNVVAIVSDEPVAALVPVFGPDDIAAIADFILGRTRTKR